MAGIIAQGKATFSKDSIQIRLLYLITIVQTNQSIPIPFYTLLYYKISPVNDISALVQT